MRFYWVLNILIKGHYLVYWERCKYNLSYYFNKQHPNKHQRAISITYLVPIADSINHSCYELPSNLRRCVKSPLTGKRTTGGQVLLPLQAY